MGLLDDAIREHLDLKRRRGADPSEVARAEQEALGPVRREPTSGEPAAEHHKEHEHPPEAAAEAPREARPAEEGFPPADATRVLDPSERHEGHHGDPLHDEASHKPQEPSEEPDSAQRPGAETADADRAGGAGEDDSATPLAESPRPGAGPARSDAEPEPEHPEPQQHKHDEPKSSLDQPTTEYRVEDHHDDEDVLEETPEFLQETPEHDRLWFEQRPPRDFDFDG